LKVLQVNKHYSPPHVGGVEVVVRRLSEGLVRHAGASVRALVSNETRDWVEETIGGVQVVRLPRQVNISSAPIAASMPFELHQMSRSSGSPDVVNLHSPYPWGEVSFLMARPNVPSVVLYHSDIVRQRRLLAAYRPFLERFLDAVDLIMVSSPNMLAHSPFLTPRTEKCRVIPFGLPNEYFKPPPAVIARAAQLRASHAGRTIVLFVGRLVYYKGVDVLVRAMAQVDADLVLVGSGPLEATVRELAGSQGVAARLTLLPPQNDAELLAWYRAADIFCLPSVARSEAFGLVQIEAHAAGTPVVSTDLPTGVPYANLDGVTGLIVPPGDTGALAGALRRLLDDAELRARLGAQAHARALSEFTVSRMVEQTLQVYAEAVDVHARRQGTA
jgi:glycosyltransferase involved in cell wall biosynthesis